MLKLQFRKTKKTLLKILCLGGHSDDIEIGCGGSILRILLENSNTEVHWIVFAANGERASEATFSAEHFLTGASRKKIVIKEFRDSFFPYIGGVIKQYYETICTRITG